MKLTRTGLGVLAAAIVLGALGVRWRYVELVVLSGVAIVAVATAWLAVHRPVGLVVVGRVLPRRVERGSTVPVRLRLENHGRRSVPPVVVIDTLLGATAETFLASVPIGGERILDYELRAHRRGVHPVGPLFARRQDLLGLVAFERVIGEPDDLIVHPRVLDLSGSSGADHVTDLETQLRRASHDPMAGFQSLREYVRGDDTRTIHWPSTARAGHLIVREFVDARRPRLTIVLDTAVASHTEDGFEEAVDVAASLSAHALRVGLEIVLRTNDRQQRGDPRPLRNEADMLELLARVSATSGPELLPFAPLLTLDALADSVVVVTGPHGSFPRLPQLADRLTSVRIGGTDGFRRPGTIAAPDAVAFQRAWAVRS